jgi:hypothetical protein
MQDQLVVIGGWNDPASRTLRLQDFIIDGRSFIPIFSDEATFKRQAAGTPFEQDGLVIDRALLLSVLRDDELLILNPADPDALKMTKADLAAGVDRDAAEVRKA